MQLQEPTRHVFASSDCYDFEGVVGVDADFDDVFVLISDDDGKAYRLNGWLFIVEEG